MSGVRAHILAVAGLCLAGAGVGIGCSGAAADTLEWALVQAYQNNPSLNAQRASLRAVDENVPQALSGYRPKVSATAGGGYNYTNAVQQFPLGGVTTDVPFAQTFYSRTVGATGTYTLFNGYQTANRTRQAESQVDAARETLRVTEQQVLLDAATAYMNLLRDSAILDLNRRNVEVLTEQLKQTRDRFNVGEVTRTDVAQAELRLAAGRSALLGAQSNYVTSQAVYRRVIGVDAGRLAPGTPVDRLSPNVLAKAIAQGQALSPSVLAAKYGVDVATLAVKISEGSLYPNLTLNASVLQGQDPAFEIHKADGGFRRRSIDHSALPGRSRIFRYPPIQGDAGPTAAQSRYQPRSGPGYGGAKLGPARCRQGANRGDDGAGQCRRDRTQRRSRGGARRSAHHARRPQRPTGTGQRPRGFGHGAARSRGGLIHLAGGGRRIVNAEIGPQCSDLRSYGALSAGP